MAYSAYDAFLSLNQISTNSRGYYDDSLQNIVDDRFEYSSDYREISLLDRATLVATSIGVRLTKPNSINGSADLKDDFFKVVFKNFNTQIVLGDLFEFDNYRWLVVDVSSIDENIQSCMIQRCNIVLKFVDTNNDVLPTISDTVISINAIAEKKIYDEERDKYYNLPLEEIQVRIPNSVNGRKIKSGRSTGTRFIIGSRAYSTLGVDDISLVRIDINSSDVNNGIIILKLKVSAINEREDNISESVAKQRCYGG